MASAHSTPVVRARRDHTAGSRRDDDPNTMAQPRPNGRNNHLSLDEARLLPHLRATTRKDLHVRFTTSDEAAEQLDRERRKRDKLKVPTARDLRGIPCVGRDAGAGTMRGTNPLAYVLSRDRHV